MEVIKVNGIGKESGKPYTAYQIKTKDTKGRNFLSDLIFTRFHEVDENGNRLLPEYL